MVEDAVEQSDKGLETQPSSDAPLPKGDHALPWLETLPAADQLQPAASETLVRFELGRTQVSAARMRQFTEGSVITLDKTIGETVDIFVNDRLFARGEVLVMNDKYCIRVAEILNRGR